MERAFVENKFKGQDKSLKYISNIVDKMRNQRPGSKKLLVEFEEWKKTYVPPPPSDDEDSDDDCDTYTNPNIYNGYDFMPYLQSLERDFMSLVENGDLSYNQKKSRRNDKRRENEMLKYKEHCESNGKPYDSRDVPWLVGSLAAAPWKSSYTRVMAVQEAHHKDYNRKK